MYECTGSSESVVLSTNYVNGFKDALDEYYIYKAVQKDFKLAVNCCCMFSFLMYRLLDGDFLSPPDPFFAS